MKALSNLLKIVSGGDLSECKRFDVVRQYFYSIAVIILK